MDEGQRRSAPPRRDAVISDERYERYHAFAREKGTSRVLYYLARIVLVPAALIWFRLQRTGREHARVKGGLIVAANHRSFLDPFVIGAFLPWRRRLQFIAKVELFEKRWQGWFLSRLGAFPIRRGQSDETAMKTARMIVERGGAVVIFSEGNRIWPNIELQWEWLGGLPPLRKAAVIGSGSWGTAVAVLLARGGLEVELGTRTDDKAQEIRRRGENEEYLPGVKLPEGMSVKRASEIEIAGCDLICLAVPSKALPQVVGAFADRIGSRASVLLLS